MVGAWRCAANTVEAVWRGKDKPTLLVECFYDLLTSVLSPHRQRWVWRNWQLVRASRAGRRKKHGKFEYEFTASDRVNCQEWQDNVVLLSLALVFFHLLIRILAPDPPKVNNEQVNSDHLPSGSRPLTLGDPRVRHKPAKTHQQIKNKIKMSVTTWTLPQHFHPWFFGHCQSVTITLVQKERTNSPAKHH